MQILKGNKFHLFAYVTKKSEATAPYLEYWIISSTLYRVILVYSYVWFPLEKP